MPASQAGVIPRFHLLTLGHAALVPTDPAGATPLLGPGKSLALITYLAFTEQRAVRRVELVELLWGDRDPERGRNSLRQLLWQLRQRTSDTLLDGDEEVIRLTGTLTTDRDQFLAAMQARQYEQAVTIYRGPFLPDFALPGGLGFEHWAEGERAGLRAMFQQAGAAATRALLARGEMRDAVLLARRIRDAEPGREGGWRFLLESCIAAGDWLTLTRETESLATWLAAEHRSAESATTALLTRIREGRTALAPIEDRPPVADLIGRSAQFATLLQAWEQAQGGRAAHGHVVAPAGLGKSRLAVDMFSRLRTVGATVVSCRARPGERGIAWALLGDLVDALGRLPGAIGVAPDTARLLVRLAPTLSSLFGAAATDMGTPHDRRAAGLALLDLLAAVTQDRPLALVIDDLHWADDASREALFLTLQRIEALPLLVLTLSRPEERAEPTMALRRRLELPPLTPEETGQLVSSMAALPAEQWAMELPTLLHGAAEGIPLQIMDSLALLVERGQLSYAGGAWSCTDPTALQRSLQNGGALRIRLQALSKAGAALLLVGAVAGRPFPATILAATVGKDEAGINSTLEQMERDGFLLRGAAGWEVGHDRIAELLLEGSDAAAQRVVHAALGRALLAEGVAAKGDAPVIAQHLLAGGDTTTLRRLIEREVEAARRGHDRRAARAIVSELLGGAGGVELVDHLTGGLPLRLRARWFGRRLAVATTLVVGTAAAAILLLTQPRLVLVAQPIGLLPLTPAPTVEIRNRLGARVSGGVDTVKVEVASGPGPVDGETSVVAVEGRAVFDELNLPQPGRYVLRFTALRAGAVESDTIYAEDSEATQPRLRITGGQINAVRLDPEHPGVTVAPATRLEGSVNLVYRSTWSTAAVFLCGTASWGSPRTAGWTVQPLSTPTLSTLRTAPVDLRAPEVPGHYRIIFALYADRSCDFILSATNWKENEAVWDDGNDLAAMDSATVHEAVMRGTISVRQLRTDADKPPRSYQPTAFGAAVIDVIVQ